MFIVVLSDSILIKGGLIMALMWWIWFQDKDKSIVRKTRATVLATIIGTLGVLLLVKFLALILPVRLSPMHNPDLPFLVPYGLKPTSFKGWSSFPSDHAALFFALATGILMTSRRLGCFVFFYVAVIVAMPRIYLGLHYPTDIIGGAVLGIGITMLVNMPSFKIPITNPFLNWLEKHPASFYAILFVLTFEITELFLSVRMLAKWLFKVLKTIIG